MIFSTLELLVSAELCSLDLKIAIEAPIEAGRQQWLSSITAWLFCFVLSRMSVTLSDFGDCVPALFRRVMKTIEFRTRRSFWEVLEISIKTSSS